MEDSGYVLKWIAAVIAGSLFCCAFFVLKTDPIRNDTPERAHAVQQVKQFAQFIETKPSFPKAEPKQTIAKSNIKSLFVEELERRLQNNEQQDSQFLPFLIEHQSELSGELSDLFGEKTVVRNSFWEKKMELLKLVFQSDGFSEELKSTALRIFSLELLSARVDPLPEIQQKADQWAEDYMKSEKRMPYMNAFISAYELKRSSSGH